MERLKEKLSAPSTEYKSLPFWSWNDELDENELCWQIRQMKDAGIGGFFMHARGGLKTPYMSEAWMRCVEVCLREAERLDMEAWLYDEEGWPSGFAGGAVTALGDLYHTRWLELEQTTCSQAVWDDSVMGIYSGEFRRLSRKTVCGRPSETCFIVRQVANPHYIDVLNVDTVKAFLHATHEVYRERFPGMLGNRICGFFTDEPQYAKFKIPYSHRLPERFLRENGYEVFTHLPALFLDAPESRKFRYDYWKTVSKMFTESFCKTIYEWCEENRCRLTGHIMREDSLLMQMQATAGVMPSYEYMHMPGIDWLRRRISSPLTPKQAGSVAEQLGKKFVISEMFAMVGWDCTPLELKWIALWQYVNGVNKMCHHLEAYSLRGIRKRDFPASQFYQQPWWEEYRGFNDYFSRLGVLLTEGRIETDVLLLHPMRSSWILYDGREEGALAEFGKKFENISQRLADLHIDHHYGDEEILARHGRVQSGRLFVGKCGYRAVLIPDMLTIEKSTLKLLYDFSKAGGHIYSLGGLPEYTENGAREMLDYLRRAAERVPTDELKAAVDGIRSFPISITENGEEAENLHYHLRKTDEGRMLFLADLNREGKRDVLISLKGLYDIVEYDPLRDCFSDDARQWHEDGHTLVALTFEAADGKVLFIQNSLKSKMNRLGGQAAQKEAEKETVYLDCGGRWEIVHSGLNAMLLDACEYRINGGSWRPRLHIIRLMDVLLQNKARVQADLRFSFNIRTDPSLCREIYLVAEAEDVLTLLINGEQLTLKEQGWWLDKSFRKYDIRRYLSKGKNELVLEIDFWQRQKVYDVLFGENVLETEKNRLTFDTEIENLYLLGDFGVFNENAFTYSWRREVIASPDFVLDKMPAALYGDDFTSQGLCFFSGKIRLRQKLFLHDFDDSRDVKIQSLADCRYIYRFPRPHAAVAKLYVNKRFVRTVYWGPYEEDLTGYVHAGENELEWELYSSNRNLLGPHHHVDGELYAVWPADFTGNPSPFKADESNVWSDKYHLVKFGF